VIQFGRSLCLTLKSFSVIIMLAQIRWKKLQCYLTLKTGIFCQIYLAHPTGTDFGDNLIMTDFGAFGQGYKRLGLVIVAMILRHVNIPAFKDWQ
jgi:hypothetical protein